MARYVAQLAEQQQHNGWSVWVATPPESMLVHRLSDTGVTVLPWTAGPAPSVRLIAETTSLRELLRRVEPDVVHLHSSKAGLAGRVVIRGRIPTLYQPHAWPFTARRPVITWLLRRWESWAGHRWSTRIVCVSEEEMEQGQSAGVDVSRMETIVNGVDLQAFPAADDEDRRMARTALGMPDGPLVVCVARLHRQKGQHFLLDAWPEVQELVPGARLALVGDGPDREQLRSRADDTIILPGATDDPHAWYAAADVVVLPSLWEGLALSSLEALATARPLVITSVSGSRIVRDAGAGQIVQFGDTHGLARALADRLLAPDRAAAEGRAGRKFIERHHDIRIQLSRLNDVTRQLAR